MQGSRHMADTNSFHMGRERFRHGDDHTHITMLKYAVIPLNKANRSVQNDEIDALCRFDGLDLLIQKPRGIQSIEQFTFPVIDDKVLYRRAVITFQGGDLVTVQRLGLPVFKRNKLRPKAFKKR